MPTIVPLYNDLNELKDGKPGFRNHPNPEKRSVNENLNGESGFFWMSHNCKLYVHLKTLKRQEKKTSEK